MIRHGNSFYFDAAQPTHVLVLEWGAGNPDYWTDIETYYPANGS